MTTFTEAEAESKWCPQARSHYCIASRCMAWRWGTDVEEGLPYKLSTLFSSVTMPGIPIVKQSKTHGYCGMVKS